MTATGEQRSDARGANMMDMQTRTGDAELFGPESVTWRIHAHPSALVAGIQALLVQALHPLALAGVVQHSHFRDDPWGRLQRTSDYVAITTFGDTTSALALAETVKRVHRHIRGVDDI